MNDPLTREEVKAMLDVQTKNTEQMVLIAQRLQKIVEQNISIADCQEKVVNRLYNGLAKEIKDGVKEALTEKFKVADLICSETKKDVKIIKGDVFWIKIIFGAIAFITATVVAIMQLTHWFGQHGVM